MDYNDDTMVDSNYNAREIINVYREISNLFKEITMKLQDEIKDYSILKHLYEECFKLNLILLNKDPDQRYNESTCQVIELLQMQYRMINEQYEEDTKKRNAEVNIIPKQYFVLSQNKEHGDQYTKNNVNTRLPESKGATASTDNANPRKSERLDNITMAVQIPLSTGLKCLAGLPEVKKILWDALFLPVQFPHLFTKTRRPFQTIMLYGPPGTGKTEIAHAIAAEAKAVFYNISSTTLLSTWFGESEKTIQELFCHVKKLEKTVIIFMDEIDGLCRARSSTETDITRRVKTELLNQLGNLASLGSKVFLICATNCPWDLDTAFLRRFQKRIYIPLPDRDSRLAIFKLKCGDCQPVMSARDWELLLDRTDGYSGSDITHLVTRALYLPVSELNTATHWNFTQDEKVVPCKSTSKLAIEKRVDMFPASMVAARDVMLVDFLSVLSDTKPTVTKEEIQRYKKYSSS